MQATTPCIAVVLPGHGAVHPQAGCSLIDSQTPPCVLEARLACYARSAPAFSADAACLDDARRKFAAAYAKADAKGPCPGDVGEEGERIDGCVDETVAALAPAPTTTTTSAPTTTIDAACTEDGAPCGERVCGTCGSCFPDCIRIAECMQPTCSQGSCSSTVTESEVCGTCPPTCTPL
ncbi:MAG TPA: hypothetical protein VEC57_18365 [Candidatus Limnocylindrales bacterium]|nr:hypothetical protein [Candidatus Limnocylindrales bacterium]